MKKRASVQDRPVAYRRMPLMLALEPRIMFDAAAVATADAALPAGLLPASKPLADSAHAIDSPIAKDGLVEAHPATPPDREATQSRQTIVFVDTSISDYQSLLRDIDPAAEVVLIGADQNGLQVIADTLAGRSGIDAIHILSHGDVGKIQLGNEWIDQAGVASHANLLSAIGNSLAEHGDILLYGCYIGADGAGVDFIQSLATETGADVAASNDLTGAASKGGNWTLEATQGSVETYSYNFTGYSGLLTAFSDTVGSDPIGGGAHVSTYATTLGGVSYTYTFTAQGEGGDMAFDSANGFGNSSSILVTSLSFNASTTERITVARTDTADFTFDTLFINNSGGSTVSVGGYLNGTLVGSTQTVSTGASSTLSFGGLLVDEVRLTATDFFNTNFDNFGGDTNPPDTTPPTVSSVTSSTSNGSYNAGDAISIQVNFSEAVLVTGTPRLTLETGTTDQVVNYASGSGTSTLTFTYTVQAGDTTADLDYQSTTALALNGGTIRDAASNNATLTLASPGAANSLGANKAIVVDTTAPTVSSVNSSTVNGTYKVGDTVSIQVNFSEAVTVTGTPQLTLETGTTDQVINYASGSGTSTLTFTYTVQAGDTSADLDYQSTTALALNGGTIRDAAGNNGTLTLASPGAANSLGNNKAIVIDGVVPTVTSVNSSTVNGSYKVGDTVSIQVNFSEAVTVTGTPQLTLETGTTDQVINYASGSGTSTLTFTYTVQAGDTSADLDYQSTTALALNGGTIRDAAGNNGTLTLASPGAANSLGNNKAIVIDTTAPTVSSVNSSTVNGTYKVGDTVSIQVNFSEAVTVTGTPQLTLETGTTDQVINYASGSGTSTLTFTYTVQAGDTSADLDYQSTTALALNGGTIRDVAGNNGTLTLASPGAANSLGNNKAIVIDGVVPTVTSVNSSTANATYKVGDTVSIQVNFSEAVVVTGTPQLTLETGTTDQVVNYASGSGTSTLTFTYTVQAGDISADLDYQSTTALALNGGTIRDAAGNNGTLTLVAPGTANSLGNNKAIVIDGVAPTVTSVNSSTANGAYKVGDTVSIQVNFSEAVVVTGTPQLTLETGTTDRVVNYASGSGTSTLTFTYTVQAGDTNADLDYQSTTALALNGGTIRDAAGNNGTLTLASPGAANSLGNNKALVIDGVVPTVTSVNSSTANGTYRVGDTISVQVNFSEAVTVTGTPQLTLETGTTDRAVNYASGSGTSTLTFTYTVQVGDTNADLDYQSTTALALNGGTIRDAAGNNGVLTLASPGAANSLGNNKALVVDGLAPAVASINSVTPNGTYGIGSTVTVAVNFSEVIFLSTGTLQLTLETGATDRAISYVSGSGTSILYFDYTVQTGDTSPDLDYISTSALALNGDTIQNGSFVNAVLTLPTPGAANSLGANQAIVVDGIRPTASIVVADTALAAGETSTVTITFNEAVTGFTTADLTVANGVLSGLSSADGGITWTATLTPTTSIEDAANLITLDNTGVQDLANNAGAGTTDSNNYAIDTVRPVVSIALSDYALIAGETATATFTFSEAVSGFGNADITVNSGTLSAVASADGGITWTATFTPTINTEDATNFIGVDNTGYVDAGGNTGTGTTGTINYTVDTLRPTATIVVADTALAAGETSLVTITFSEAVTGFTNADLTVANGALSAVSSSDGGITWTATLTPTASITDATNLVTLANTGVQDAAGNTGISTTDSNNYAIDTARPTATIVVTDNALAIGETSLVTVTFNEAVTGFTNADLSVANGTLSAVSSSDGGITWTATLTPTASITDSTNLVTLSNTGVQDAAGNTGSGTTDSNNYAIDSVRPTATVVVADTALAAGETSLVTITFSEAVTGFTNADLAIANGTLSAVNSSDGGVTWTATFTPTAGITDTTNLITLNNAGVQDIAGNAGTGTTDSNNYAIDTQRPTATVVVADTALAAGETSLVTITMSEAVANFDNADLSAANGTLSTAVTADGGITWTATLTPTAGITDTTNVVTFDSTGVIDGGGNIGAGAINSNNYAIDTARPTTTIVVADNALAIGETSLVTITFSEAVTGFTNADLTIANGTLSAVSSSDGGITWTATFTPTASITDTTNVITLANTGVLDAAGNAGVGTTDSNNYAIDSVRPTVAIVIADNALAAGETSLVTITFSEAVTGFTNADLTIANGTLSAVSSSDGGVTWTATLTPTAATIDTTNLITLANTGIQDVAGNAGTGTTDSNNYAIDTDIPVITTVSVPVNGTYMAGQNLDFTVDLSDAVTVNTAGGTPRIAITLDAGGTVYANYLSGSSTTALVFRATVAVGQLDTNGISVGSALDANGGSVRDVAGNNAALSLNGVGNTTGVRVDAVAPTASNIVLVETLPTNSQTLHYTLTFSENVSGVDATDLQVVTTGSVSATIASVAQVDPQTYTVTLNGVQGSGTLRVDLKSSGTGVADVAGNPLTAGLTGTVHSLGGVAPDILVTHAGDESPATVPNYFSPNFATNVPLPMASPSVLNIATESPSISSLATVFTMPTVHNVVVSTGRSFDLPVLGLRSSDFSNWSVVELRSANGAPLPAWIYYNSTTGRLQGTPPANFRGTLQIEVVVTDSHGHRTIDTVQLRFGDASPRATVDRLSAPEKHAAARPVSEKPGLDAQFARHARNAPLDLQAARALRQLQDRDSVRSAVSR